jgi:hypothetical protein
MDMRLTAPAAVQSIGNPGGEPDDTGLMDQTGHATPDPKYPEQEVDGKQSESKKRKWGRRIWRGVVGLVFNWFFLGSILVLGWTLRLVRYFIVWSWWRNSPVRSQGTDFQTFQSRLEGSSIPHRFPEWFTDTSPSVSGWRRWMGGLTQNIRTGCAGLFNVWIFTLPGALLWTVAWYAGWQNSFNKGYEQAAIGPLTFILGILLFVGAMFYVPIAQARQASTGNWRAFYDFGLIWRLIRRRWFAHLILAIAFVLASLPINILKTAPAFLGMADDIVAMSARQQYGFITFYFLTCGIVVLPLFVGLRLLAAWIYAGALREAVVSGGVLPSELADAERETLRRLGWLDQSAPAVRGKFVRFLACIGSRTGRILSAIGVGAVWLTFVFQLLASEFVQYHKGGRGWWNQPLIQVPWFDYAPSALLKAALADGKSSPDQNGEGA